MKTFAKIIFKVLIPAIFIAIALAGIHTQFRLFKEAEHTLEKASAGIVSAKTNQERAAGFINYANSINEAKIDPDKNRSLFSLSTYGDDLSDLNTYLSTVEDLYEIKDYETAGEVANIWITVRKESFDHSFRDYWVKVNTPPMLTPFMWGLSAIIAYVFIAFCIPHK